MEDITFDEFFSEWISKQRKLTSPFVSRSVCFYREKIALFCSSSIVNGFES